MSRKGESSTNGVRGLQWVKTAGILALLLIAVGWIMMGERTANRTTPAGSPVSDSSASMGGDRSGAPRDQRWRKGFASTPQQTAEEVVASKVAEFGRKRLAWVRAKGLREGKEVPREVEEFFEALRRGNWDEIEKSFEGLAKRSAQYEGSTHWPELDPFWPAVLEAYGAVEQAHLWPAEKLLEYGASIMESLRPGMVYVGGTDAGRFVPTLLNETGEGEPGVVLTQNALADSRYLGYIREQFGDRMTLPTEDDNKAIFDAYVSDAKRRLEHDQQFPDEPKQIRPGEQVKMVDDKVEVGGQIAVMTINEKLLQWMVERNPELSFAVEESFPFRSTYGSAAPLGPIMELKAEEPMEQRHADATLVYWRDQAEALKRGEPVEDSTDRKTYSHMAVAHANLLGSRGYTAEAEATYRVATEIYSRSVDAVLGYAQFLSEQGRPGEANQLITQFREQNPDLNKELAAKPIIFSVSAPP